MKEYIELVAEGKDLTEEQAKAAMEILLSGEASQAPVETVLILLMCLPLLHLSLQQPDSR